MNGRMADNVGPSAEGIRHQRRGPGLVALALPDPVFHGILFLIPVSLQGMCLGPHDLVRIPVALRVCGQPLRGIPGSHHMKIVQALRAVLPAARHPAFLDGRQIPGHQFAYGHGVMGIPHSVTVEIRHAFHGGRLIISLHILHHTPRIFRVNCLPGSHEKGLQLIPHQMSVSLGDASDRSLGPGVLRLSYGHGLIDQRHHHRRRMIADQMLQLHALPDPFRKLGPAHKTEKRKVTLVHHAQHVKIIINLPLHRPLGHAVIVHIT